MAAVARRSLVQYVVLRGDLLREPFSWPLGASVAQACHAALAVAPDECALSTLAERLQQNGIDHKVWIEQPENIATCIALRPYQKEHVHHHLKNFKLLK
ncbi:hypothetical protein E2320_018592 [Naja naja]|nr:hypothetical protein E2320_018592 [Naja naja]